MTVALDESTFTRVTQEHRRELHVHCYRMLASFDDAEDAVQETLLLAWRGRTQFTGAYARAWLYKIATNVCLNLIRTRSRRLRQLNSYAEVSWLQPYPDRLLDEMAPPDSQPDSVAVARETVELAFLTALQVLPGRQRAVLIARDVLDLTAAETAAMLDTSVAGVNSALQRARATLAGHLPARRSEWRAAGPTPGERELLLRFIDAHQRCDAEAALALVGTDIRVTMPPYPWRFDGIEALGTLLERGLGPEREGDWRLLPTSVNRMPAAASYLRRHGDSTYRGYKLDVLRTVGPAIAEITTFGPELFAASGLPLTLGTAGTEGSS